MSVKYINKDGEVYEGEYDLQIVRHTTSHILAQAIKYVFQDEFDLVICGQFASDGDTAQTGVGIAVNLNIPVVTYISSLIEVNDDSIVVQQNFEDSFNIVKTVFLCHRERRILAKEEVLY